MKKILLSLLAVMISFTALAQTERFKITINNSEGKQAEWNLTGKGKTVSSMKHNGNNQLEIYLNGENTGAKETYDINKINNISFSIYHESEVGDVNLADPSATEKTKRLYKYLQLNYGSKTISSVIANVNWNTQEADKIYQATGKYPAMNCYDFIHIYVPKQGSNGWINYNDITPVTNWADQGGLVSLMWHFNVPKTESTVPGANGSGVTCTPIRNILQSSQRIYCWLLGEQMVLSGDGQGGGSSAEVAGCRRCCHLATIPRGSRQCLSEIWCQLGQVLVLVGI